jgi:hypothetical protein
MAGSGGAALDPCGALGTLEVECGKSLSRAAGRKRRVQR